MPLGETTLHANQHKSKVVSYPECDCEEDIEISHHYVMVSKLHEAECSIMIKHRKDMDGFQCSRCFKHNYGTITWFKFCIWSSKCSFFTRSMRILSYCLLPLWEFPAGTKRIMVDRITKVSNILTIHYIRDIPASLYINDWTIRSLSHSVYYLHIK